MSTIYLSVPAARKPRAKKAEVKEEKPVKKTANAAEEAKAPAAEKPARKPRARKAEAPQPAQDEPAPKRRGRPRKTEG